MKNEQYNLSRSIFILFNYSTNNHLVSSNNCQRQFNKIVKSVDVYRSSSSSSASQKSASWPAISILIRIFIQPHYSDPWKRPNDHAPVRSLCLFVGHHKQACRAWPTVLSSKVASWICSTRLVLSIHPL